MIYIDSPSLDSTFHFALEVYLMEELNISDSYFLFWRTRPTLMIGRYQNTLEEINTAYVRDKGIDVVRRVSGGGTIYTDTEGWQFSFIQKNREPSAIEFKTYTAPILEALAELGVTASLSGRNDLLIGERKFSGNAQYNSARCTLHHGSILYNTNIEEMVKSLTVSDEKIISKSIKSIRQRVTNVMEHMPEKLSSLGFKEVMLKHLLKGGEGIYALTPKDVERVEAIAGARFRTWEWNYGKSPRFEIIKGKRLNGGRVEFRMNVREGLIEECSIYGDFFGNGDVDGLANALIGCPYREDAIRRVLVSLDADKLFFRISLEELLSAIL